MSENKKESDETNQTANEETNKINPKAERFRDFLVRGKIAAFYASEQKDELNTTIFHTDLLIKGQKTPLLFITDDSIYSLLRIRVAAGEGSRMDRAGILDCLNELNGKYKIFKYSLSGKAEILLDISLPSANEKFDPELVFAAINVATSHLEEEMPGIMHKLWAGQTLPAGRA
jgi:hypothetical protein